MTTPCPRPMAAIRSYAILMVVFGAIIGGCNPPTDLGGPLPTPSYSWRGKVVDGTSDTLVYGDFVLSVSEEAEHDAAGWFAGFNVTYLPDDRFFASYGLGAFYCSRDNDTTLSLHLTVTDTSGIYGPATHASVLVIGCDPIPGAMPMPFPSEDSVVIRLFPVP